MADGDLVDDVEELDLVEAPRLAQVGRHDNRRVLPGIVIAVMIIIIITMFCLPPFPQPS